MVEYLILKYLSILAILQLGLLLAFTFVKKNTNKTNRNILAAIFSNFTIFLAGTFLNLYGYLSPLFIVFGHFANLAIFITTPLLYFYILSLLDINTRIKKSDFFHLFTFLAILITMIVKVSLSRNPNFFFELQGIILMSLLFAQSIYYFILIVKVFSKELKNSTQGLKKQKQLKWLKYFIVAYFVILFSKIIVFISWNIINHAEFCLIITNTFFLIAFILINSIILISMFDASILLKQNKYADSSLKIENIDEIYHRLKKYMEEEKPYLNSLLTIEKLAKPIGVSSKYLSQIIREQESYGFNEFINKYRIEEVKKNIADPDQLDITIIDHAYQAGFNSKSTFNTAFKKIVGTTPSNYRNSQIKK